VGGLHIAMVVGSHARHRPGVGWRNSVRPTFAILPRDDRIMTSIGLAAFVAMIGLKAGPYSSGQ
jgi:putative transport protein